MTITPTPSGDGYTAMQLSRTTNAPIMGFGDTRAQSIVDCMQRLARINRHIIK